MKRVKMPKFQFHATALENVPSIERHGLRLPGVVEVATHRYAIPTISTADDEENARCYHPSGALIVLRVRPGAVYLEPSSRDLRRRHESLEDTVERLIEAAWRKHADGVRMPKGYQSSVGNQTLNPDVLEVVGVMQKKGSP